MCVCVCLSVIPYLRGGELSTVRGFSASFSLVVSHPTCYLCNSPRELFPAEEHPPAGASGAVCVDVVHPGTPVSACKARQEPSP